MTNRGVHTIRRLGDTDAGDCSGPDSSGKARGVTQIAAGSNKSATALHGTATDCFVEAHALEHPQIALAEVVRCGSSSSSGGGSGGGGGGGGRLGSKGKLFFVGRRSRHEAGENGQHKLHVFVRHTRCEWVHLPRGSRRGESDNHLSVHNRPGCQRRQWMLERAARLQVQ
jgi:hypothetical protein